MTRHIAVIGAGVMGHAIAAEFAMYGNKVALFDQAKTARDAAPDRIAKDLQFMVDNGFLTAEQRTTTLRNIRVCETLEEAGKHADFVVEAIAEIAGAKADLFETLNGICRPETIFCTNTSSLPLSAIIDRLPQERRQRCIVCHYFNPANIIPCIELSLFGDTAQSTYDAVAELYRSVRKHPIKILKDVPGMVGNRLQLTLYREAAYLLDQGVTTAADLDECLKYGPAFRYAAIGMLGSYDMNGLSLTRHVADNIWPDLCNATDTTGGIIEEMDRQGKDGIRSGEGYFHYPAGHEEEIRAANTRKLLMQLQTSARYETIS